MKKVLLLALVVCWGLSACSSAPQQEIPVLRIAAETNHRKALQAIRVGDVLGAEELWRDALLAYQSIDDWPGQGMARLGLAQAQARLLREDLARQTLQPLVSSELFSEPLRAQANLQMAQLVDVESAERYLANSRKLCAEKCNLHWAQANTAAKLAAQREDWSQVVQLSRDLLAHAPATERVELAHAHRLLARALLAQQQAPAALSSIESALVLDRQLARPDWLLADYRVRLAIAHVLSDVSLVAETEQKIASLCQAMRC